MKTKPLLDKEQLPNIRNAVIASAHRRGTSLRELSLRMGRNANFLSDTLARSEPRITLLLELSMVLNENLLEPYLNLLPPLVRPTGVERDLLTQIDRLQQERDSARADRDKFWAVIEKRG